MQRVLVVLSLDKKDTKENNDATGEAGRTANLTV
jgi:hypothetical protein